MKASAPNRYVGTIQDIECGPVTTLTIEIAGGVPSPQR
jgi:molybdopterin-binding protein